MLIKRLCYCTIFVDKNICQPLKCSHLCLLTLDKAECACYDGYLLLANTTDQCIGDFIYTF